MCYVKVHLVCDLGTFGGVCALCEEQECECRNQEDRYDSSLEGGHVSLLSMLVWKHVMKL